MGSKNQVCRQGLWPALSIVALILSGCSSSTERAAVCERSIGLQNEFTAVAQTLDDIASASPQQLANTFAVTIATLTTLSDLGPSSLRSDFGVLLGVYESLAASIEATGWNGAVAVSDRVVIEARAHLISNDAFEARNSIRSYAIKNCATELGIDIEQFQGVPTTLPSPIVPDENAPDPTTGFDNDDSIASSYGYYVAEQYNLAITNEQAICIGRMLIEQATVNLQQVDNSYTEFISAMLTTCGVEANISGS